MLINVFFLKLEHRIVIFRITLVEFGMMQLSAPVGKFVFSISQTSAIM